MSVSYRIAPIPDALAICACGNLGQVASNTLGIPMILDYFVARLLVVANIC